MRVTSLYRTIISLLSHHYYTRIIRKSVSNNAVFTFRAREARARDLRTNGASSIDGGSGKYNLHFYVVIYCRNLFQLNI